MRWFASLLVVGICWVAPSADARASCAADQVEFSPSWGHRHTGDPAVRVPPNPTMFAFWRPNLEPTFKVVCEADGAAVPSTFEELASESDATVTAIQVDTAACSRFVVRVLRGKHVYGPKEEAVYEVDSELEHHNESPEPGVMSAHRENRRLGCGASDHLSFETNVRPAALRVEVMPGEHETVVPLRLYDAKAVPTEPGEFWLGRTMCGGATVRKVNLDQPMSLRLTALYTDGSTRTGPWQEVGPPQGYRPGDHDVEYRVEEPPASLRAAEPKPAARAWLWWFLLFLPGALAAAWIARWAALRRC